MSNMKAVHLEFSGKFCTCVTGSHGTIQGQECGRMVSQFAQVWPQQLDQAMVRSLGDHMGL